MAAKVGGDSGGDGGDFIVVVGGGGGGGGGAAQGDDAGASPANRFLFVVVLTDAAGDDGILGAHHLGPVARVLGDAERFLGNGIPVGGEDTGVPLTFLFVEDCVDVTFLGSLALLDGLRIDEIFEASDADALGVDSLGTSAGNVVDDVTLMALGVLFGGKAGLEFRIGVFGEAGDEVDPRPAVEADLTRTTAEIKMMVASTGSSGGFG